MKTFWAILNKEVKTTISNKLWTQNQEKILVEITAMNSIAQPTESLFCQQNLKKAFFRSFLNNAVISPKLVLSDFDDLFSQHQDKLVTQTDVF